MHVQLCMDLCGILVKFSYDFSCVIFNRAILFFTCILCMQSTSTVVVADGYKELMVSDKVL